MREVLRADPAPYQVDILQRFVDRRRMAVRAPHGGGKTALSSWVILWAMVAFDTDVKVVTTASAWRQLTHFTWPEVRKWASKADWSGVGLSMNRGKQLLEQSIKLPGKEAFAVASNNPALIEGAHASKLIYVFDEAKAIPNETWDAAEGAFSTGDCYALAISTPGDTAGRFYDIHRRRAGYEDWDTRHITLEEAIAAGRISREWADQRKLQWGEKSPLYQNRVLGDFATNSPDSLIPLAWVEQSNERWYACNGHGAPGAEESYGVDVARYGDDKTAIVKLMGAVCEQIEYHTQEDTMQTSGRVAAAVSSPEIPIGVDTVGLGAGVYDRLRELGYNVVSVGAGESTQMTDVTGERRFVKLRDALHWLVRDALDPEGDILLAVPPDDMLTSDLTAPTFKYTSNGKIKVEEKEEVKKRLGRSPDGFDGLAAGLYAPLVSGKKGFGFNF